MWGSSDFCVYDWSGWKGSLIVNISPRARRIRAKFGESPEHLAKRLPRRTRLLLVHLDISNHAPFITCQAEWGRILSQRGVAVLNCVCGDIRKRTIQDCCKAYGLPSVSAAADGRDDELLIVKTDLNSGGQREQLLSCDLKARFNLPANLGRLKGPSGYFVKRRDEVGVEFWNDPDLVVERYMTNSLGRFFRVYVAADAVVISEAYDAVQVKRMGDGVRQQNRQNHFLWRQGEFLHAYSGSESKLPPELLRTAAVFAHRFPLDYGAVDVVESETGEFYIVDVNKTPYWGEEHQPGLLEHLRLGFP
jgi:hypothetical protein